MPEILDSPVKGIDVSFANENVDFIKAREAGIRFAIIRTGYREKTDELFQSHMENALNAGLDVGAYCYCLSHTRKEARQAADYVLELIKPYKITYPVFYDIEDRSLEYISPSELTDIALSFLTRIASAGYRAGVYANPSWFINRLDTDRLKGYEIWLANWTENPNIPTKYDFGQSIWQWGVSSLPGTRGKLDSDLCYVDYSVNKPEREIYYADDFLNFRRKPGIYGEIMRVVPPGCRLLVYPDYSTSADGYIWRKADYDGLTGYVAERYLVKK